MYKDQTFYRICPNIPEHTFNIFLTIIMDCQQDSFLTPCRGDNIIYQSTFCVKTIYCLCDL